LLIITIAITAEAIKTIPTTVKIVVPIPPVVGKIVDLLFITFNSNLLKSEECTIFI
jgi:hypothetical protein